MCKVKYVQGERENASGKKQILQILEKIKNKDDVMICAIRKPCV